METIILKDNTEIKILPGASVREITAVTADFTTLGVVADALTAAGNLDKVQFQSDDVITGEYVNMKLEGPLFRSVDIKDGLVHATFSIRQKTEMELVIEELQNSQAIQDGAILELADMMTETEV